MHRLLLRLLLLAVFFNTAIGMPVHEAEHLRQVTPEIAQGRSLLEAEGDTESSERGEETHGLCAWCLTYVQQATALTSPPALHSAVAAPTALPRPGLTFAFIPRPAQWPFASRDPPHAPT